MVVLLATHKADFLSKIHGLKIHGGNAGYLCQIALLVRWWVRAYMRMRIMRAYVCRHSGEKPKASHKNGLNSGLYGLIGIRLPKRIINPIKRPKFKSYGRVRFLSVSQRAQRERK